MKVAFLARDGTIIVERPDGPVDTLDRLRFVPGVFDGLQRLSAEGYRLVMVTNQEGLGAPGYPESAFHQVQQFLLDALASQGITFDAVFVCPHRARDGCACRKPAVGLVEAYVREQQVNLAASCMIGDREADLEFARQLGVRGLRVEPDGGPTGGWSALVRQLLARRATVHRRTNETDISVSVDLDATDPLEIATGIGFLDHMLEQLARHGGFALRLQCRGDLQVDEHHTVEDCALALGQALRQALGDKRGLARYGFVLPMDEARAQVAVDLSGRPWSVFEGSFGRERVGELPTELVPHFFQSLAQALSAAVHVQVTGDNAHHMIESCFKATGRALRMALARHGHGLPSTKGTL